MTKKIFLFALLISSISFSTEAQSNGFTVQNLSKKWKLEKYKVFYFSEQPTEKEKNDYIHLKPDMTFSSISEGVYEEGSWQLDAKKSRIFLAKEKEEKELIFIVNDLSENELVLIIDDPNDEDAQYLKIHFKI